MKERCKIQNALIPRHTRFFIRNLHVDGRNILQSLYCSREESQGTFQFLKLFITAINRELRNRFHSFTAKTHIDTFMNVFHVYTGPDGTVPYRTASATRKFSCKLPEPFSSGTLRNEARGNSNEDR